MRTKEKLGIYVHIPFCKEKCAYCDFYSFNADKNLIKTYVESVILDIIEYSKMAESNIIDTIYLGGGTPSFIGYKHICEIILAVKKHFNVDKRAEITVELNPESTNLKLLKKIRKAGVNRVSMGVQTTDDKSLEKLSRLHTFATAQTAVCQAKKAKFKNISLDLIYGLEGQSVADVAKDLRNILELDVQHISTYALKIEEGTQMFVQNTQTPDDDTVADMYDRICEIMSDKGYEHYEISNFSRPGFESKHNNKYWNLDQYVGFGPSAHSFVGNARFSYVRDLEDYMQNRTICDREEAKFVSRFGEYIMLKLRTKSGVNLYEYQRLFKRDFNVYADKFEPFIEGGFATYNGDNFALTEKGMYISNYIISEILN